MRESERERETEIETCASCSQFHQRILSVFFVRNFGAKPNVTRKKLLKQCWYEKHAQITVLKLTPAFGASSFKKVIYHYLKK